MLVSCFLTALVLAFSSLVSADLAPLNSNLQLRNAPGSSPEDTLKLLHKSLSTTASKRAQDQVFKSNTSLDTNWNGVVLFSSPRDIVASDQTTVSAGVEITCTTCYIKGLATAQFTIKGGFDFKQEFDNVTSQIGNEIGNFSTDVITYVNTNIQKTLTNLGDGIDLSDFDFPPLNVSFDIDVPTIPECELQFQFDGMELFMQVDTVLAIGSTYTINLYESNTAVGFHIGGDLFVGAAVTVDLILDVAGEIDISSGFHIQLNDGVAINIPIFSHNVSEITFNGGNFEFLPVTVKSASIIITGILRIGLKVGLELSTPDNLDSIPILKATDVSVGVEAGVWVDLAQFKTNITAALPASGDVCEIRVIEEYVLAVGANVGASLAIGKHAWGPELETNTPLYYTTLLDVCASTKTANPPAVTSPITLNGRADLETTTVTYTAIQCLSTGLINCPVSLQTTSKATSTLTATIPSGGVAVFKTKNTVVTAVPFGTNAQKMISTSGTPVSFVPKPTNGNGHGGGETASKILGGSTGGVSNKIIIGVSVGLGVPLLIAIIATIIYCWRKKRYAAVRPEERVYYAQPGYHAQPSYHAEPTYHVPEAMPNTPYTPASQWSVKKSPNVEVVEYRPHY